MPYTGARNSNGKRHGQGIMTSADCSTYAGEYKIDMRNGQGTYTNAHGETYTREWIDDK